MREKNNADLFSLAQLEARGFPSPTEGIIVTHLLIVTDQDRSVEFYSHVLGGRVIRERDPAVVRLSNSWIVIDSSGGPTDDKPKVISAPPQSSEVLTSILNIRVADIWSTTAIGLHGAQNFSVSQRIREGRFVVTYETRTDT